MSEHPSLIPVSLTPPGVKDPRQDALLQAFGEMLAGIDLSGLVMTDPMTVDARLLPYMIREFSAQNFVDPDLPEHVLRRVLKNIWLLKSLHGYDAGVELGLSLLGMKAVIEHWWQVEPKRAPNTHNLTFYIGEQLFPNDKAFFGEREKQAALRMIDATKRWSQDSTVYIGVAMRPRALRIWQRVSGLRFRKARMLVRQHTPRPTVRQSVAQSTRALSVTRLRMNEA